MQTKQQKKIQIMKKEKFRVFIGSKETLDKFAGRKIKGLDPKTKRTRIISNSAKMTVTPLNDGTRLHELRSNINLKKLAKEKGLIL